MPTLVGTLTFMIVITLININHFVLRVTATNSQPNSHIVTGNPWGVVMEEATALGFALERVELLPDNQWSITARVTIDGMVENTAITANKPVVFLATPETEVPTNSREVRPFLFKVGQYAPTVGHATDATHWLVNGIKKEADLHTKLSGVQGTFQYDQIPAQTPEAKATAMALNKTTTAVLTEQHPRIYGASLVTITAPDSVVTLLSANKDGENGSGCGSGAAFVGSGCTRQIIVGLALLSTGIGGFAQFDYDYVFYGTVRVPYDIQTTPLVRSFTAITTTKYSFLTHPTVQVIETLSETSTFSYVAVITFGLSDGAKSAHVECGASSARFAIGSSISTTDAFKWKPLVCPTGPANLTGCATDFFPDNSNYCVTDTIWSNPVTKTDAIAYRVRVQLAKYTTQALPSDNIFIRIPVSAIDNSDNSTIHSFINLKAPLLASSIRCGAAVVWDTATDETDFITMALYTGTMLTPMTLDSKGAPLVASTNVYPLVASTVSNLHARGILDSVVTITLIGDDEAFPELALRVVNMVDLISIHVRLESLYDTLDSMVHTGAAYQ
ncbi:hypothetical protein T484DRAFT_1758194, partial [Baffinella frigidus]